VLAIAISAIACKICWKSPSADDVSESELCGARSLLSSSIDYLVYARTSAALVDRVLRGTKPADLAVELPLAFDLAINQKSAQTPVITIPREFLVRGDWVVQ